MPQTLPPNDPAPPRVIEPWSPFDPAAPQDRREAVVAWQALLDAGAIGRRTPVDPAIVANRDRTDALFRSFARTGTGARR